jgi:hypothetical protein
MAITFTLVESTPNRLRYLAAQDGVVTSPTNPDVDGLAVIPNDGGATPDLRTDASPGPLDAIINSRLNGFPPNTGSPVVPAGPLTQAQARALYNSDDAASAVLTNDLVGRAVVEVTPRGDGRIAWAVDVNVDGQGDGVFEVRSDIGTVADAYIDFHFRHTLDL